MFKKILIGLVLTLNFWYVTPSHAFLGAIAEVTGAVANTAGGIANTVGGIVGSVNGVVNSFCAVKSVFGGECKNRGGGGIFGGGGVRSGLNIGAENAVSNGVIVVQDFDAIFESVEGDVGVTPTGEFVLPDAESFNTIGENTSLRQYILNVLNFSLTFLGLIAVVFVIYAGFLYVTSAGDDSNMEKAKKIVIYAIIGILVILAAFAIVNTVIQNAGRGTGDRGEIPDNLGPIPGSVIPGSGGTIISPDGTVIQVNTPGGDPISSLRGSNLGNLILITGEGVQDFGSSAVVSPEAAQAGVTFGIDALGITLFDFGDGTQELLNTVENSSETTTHPFGEERTYSIRAIIETEQGQFPVRKDLIVGGIDARFTLSRAQVGVSQNVTLDATTTQVSVGSVRKYTWTCSGGEGCFTETFGRQTDVSFSAPGQYTITLTAENVLGVTDTFEKTIQVIGGAPTAAFTSTSSQNFAKPGEFTFNARASANREGNQRGLTYFWNFDGDFQQAGNPSINYEFTSTGSKSVTLVVTENFRGSVIKSEENTQEVEVESVIPVDFTVDS